MAALKAGEGRCEEASLLSTTGYIPCNQPATKIIQYIGEETMYRMCDMCADHNVRNRNAKIVGEYKS